MKLISQTLCGLGLYWISYQVQDISYLTFGKLGEWTDNIEVIYEVEDHCLMMVETNLCGVVDNERETETDNTVTR